MKEVLKELENEPCRIRPLSEEELKTFSDYSHLQRYNPSLDAFNDFDFNKNLELPSLYFVKVWIKKLDGKIWDTTLQNSKTEDELKNEKTFVKVVHLLDPIDLIKNKYTCPEHPLIPQSEYTWKNTLQKLHCPNNQAYVDAVTNFVLSRFREKNLTPHCVKYYGSLTGISDNYLYNISNEYESYRQCRWFWKGIKSNSANIIIDGGDQDINNIPNFGEIYEEITTCPFDLDAVSIDDNSESEKLCDISPIEDITDIKSISSLKSYTFDNIDDDIENNNNIFELNKEMVKLRELEKNEFNYDDIEDTVLIDRIDSDSDSDSNKSSEDGNSEEVGTECSDDEDEDEDDESEVELDLDIFLELKNMPILLILQEAQEGTMDELLDEEVIDEQLKGTDGWEARWIAWLWQVIAVLSFLQKAICFTHNDLHSNNIVWRKTDKKYLFYKSTDGTTWRVPTYGRIFSLIDFGRSIFRLGKNLWVSDDHYPGHDAAEQYNFGPFFDINMPKNTPNPSFDLCRLSVSLIDSLFDEVPPKKKGKGVSIMSEEGSWKVYETSSPLYNLLWSWTIDNKGRTIYEDKNGDEKYPGFELYIRIAHDVRNAVPGEQINKPIFKNFKWNKKIAETETVYSLGA